MAMGGTGGAGGHVRGRRRARKRPLSEINITPLVDVMLVLLIIFMISAPLLSAAVPVDLPDTEASAVDSVSEPVVVTVGRDGEIFVGETAVAWEDLVARVSEAGGPDARDKPISLRGDGRAPYQAVMRVMARLSTAGFTKLNLVSDTAASSSEEG
ncbi:biopolymer transporter ExbD [Brevundimonas sp.]|uniref:ExbD/TolR family protein n=1 Tax=Brevundimonas sp. TaxID=1871086 RepID=UPI002D3CD799|nr:biopolymer transporter ExbD [Brevundimonas sp.]HYC74295.1 biopolymer transporter ExbD [Brevundimonas sp.]